MTTRAPRQRTDALRSGGRTLKRWTCGPATLFLGDCRDAMHRLAPRCARAIITDPPYGTTNLPWDKRATDDRWWKLARRALPPKGPVVMFACGGFTFDLIAERRSELRYKWVWVRGKRFSGHLDAKIRPLRRHEDVLVFCPRQPNYYPVRRGTEIFRVPAKPATEHRFYGRSNGTAGATHRGKLLTDVLEVDAPSPKARRHPTEKPAELLDLLVRSYTTQAGTVLDPFMGAGSTGIAAVAAGRRFIGCELSPEYFAEAKRAILATIKAR